MRDAPTTAKDELELDVLLWFLDAVLEDWAVVDELRKIPLWPLPLPIESEKKP